MNFLRGYWVTAGAAAAHYTVNTHLDPGSNAAVLLPNFLCFSVAGEMTPPASQFSLITPHLKCSVQK